ncbi:hypothetical protein J6590_104667, partial [Homalodisca vitripennis]
LFFTTVFVGGDFKARAVGWGTSSPNSRGVNANVECGSFRPSAVQRLKSDPVTDLTQLLEST